MCETAQFYTDELVTAKIHHKCSECGKKILPKEKYYRIFGVWSGESDSYKFCEVCYDLVLEINARNKYSEDNICFGGLVEYLIESGDERWIKRFLEDKFRLEKFGFLLEHIGVS